MTLSACTASRIVLYTLPSSDDNSLFPRVELEMPPQTNVDCPPPPQPSSDAVDISEGTIEMLCLRGDSASFYYRSAGHPPRSCLFSISKSIVGLMTGIAVDEGLIDECDRLGRYFNRLPESLANRTIADLLDMRAGITESRYAIARLYYSDNLNSEIRSVGAVDDSLFRYSNFSTQMLYSILDRVFDDGFGGHLLDKVIRPLEIGCAWSMDSKRHGNLRSFCGAEMTAAELAKIGRIYRDYGSPGGIRIVSQEWIERSINPPHDTIDKDGATYSHHWHVLVSGEEFFAKGLFGQCLYVNRPCRTIIVRLGSREGHVDWIELMRRYSRGQIEFCCR